MDAFETAKILEKLGFVFAYGGVVTYKNAREIKETVSKIDINKIILETDAPYLTPTPYRGKLNEPKYIKYVAEEIASIKGLSIKEVEDITYRNSCEILGVSREN